MHKPTAGWLCWRFCPDERLLISLRLHAAAHLDAKRQPLQPPATVSRCLGVRCLCFQAQYLSSSNQLCDCKSCSGLQVRQLVLAALYIWQRAVQAADLYLDLSHMEGHKLGPGGVLLSCCILLNYLLVNITAEVEPEVWFCL